MNVNPVFCFFLAMLASACYAGIDDDECDDERRTEHLTAPAWSLAGPARPTTVP